MSRTAPLPHLNLVGLADVATVAGCVARVLWDSNRTGDIITAEELTAQAQLRYMLREGVFDSAEGRELLAARPHMGDVDLAALGALPADTLGGAIARFFERHELTMDIYSIPARYTADPEAAFLMERIRHSHDVWHVLMGFGTEGHEEILVHAFSLAQTGMPSSIALMMLGSLKHMLLEARFRCLVKGMAEAYARGRRAAPLLPVYWERHWETPLAAVRERYQIEPWSAADHASAEPWVWSRRRAA